MLRTECESPAASGIESQLVNYPNELNNSPVQNRERNEIVVKTVTQMQQMSPTLETSQS